MLDVYRYAWDKPGVLERGRLGSSARDENI